MVLRQHRCDGASDPALHVVPNRPCPGETSGDRRRCVRIVAEPGGLATESLFQGDPGIAGHQLVREENDVGFPLAAFRVRGKRHMDGHDIGYGRESHSREGMPRLPGRGPVYPWPGHGPGRRRGSGPGKGCCLYCRVRRPGSWPAPGSRPLRPRPGSVAGPGAARPGCRP